MSRIVITPPPTVQKRLAEVGENIRLARLRRRISSSMLAERAGISRTTLRSIENGNPARAEVSAVTPVRLLVAGDQQYLSIRERLALPAGGTAETMALRDTPTYLAGLTARVAG